MDYDMSSPENVMLIKLLKDGKYERCVERWGKFNFIAYLGYFVDDINIFKSFYEKFSFYFHYSKRSDLLSTFSEYCRIRHVKYLMSIGVTLSEFGYWSGYPSILYVHDIFILFPRVSEKHLERVNDRKNLVIIINNIEIGIDIYETIEGFL